MPNKFNTLGLFTAGFRSKTFTALLGGLVLGLAGCASSVNPNYYTLAQRTLPTQQAKLRVIEVLPLNLPDRLDRASIMVYTEQGQSIILDNDRWTSSLSMELHDSLSSGLQQQLGAVDRYNNGLPSANTVYRIAIDFSRFDIVKSTTRNQDRHVEVEVSWMIKPIEPIQTIVTNKPPIHRPLSCRMTFNQPITNGATIQDMVTASKLALNQVTTSISNAVVAVEKGASQVNNAVCS